MTRLSSLDRGLHYGDGLFETIACESGKARWLERHLARLELGCQRLGIDKLDCKALRATIESAAAAHARGLLKVIVTRGVAKARGYRPAGTETPTIIAQFYPWPAPVARPFRVDVSLVELGENVLLAGLKHLNRLEQVLAQRQAATTGVNETLMCSTSGHVICGSMSNLFLCEAAALITPGLDRCGVAGVMRGIVIDAARALSLPLEVALVSAARLRAAPAAFVTNVRLGLQLVDELEGRHLGVDPRIAQLQDWIDARVA